MKKIILLLMIMVLFSSCNTNNKDGLKDKLLKMDSYTSNVDVTVYGKNTNRCYKMKQYWQYPNKLRLEFEEPEFMKGQIIIYNNGKWTSYHPSAEVRLEIDSVLYEEDYILTGLLLKSVIFNNNTEYTSSDIDGMEYTVIRTPISDGNDYIAYAIIYFEKNGFTPAFMDIIDSKGNIRIHIKYNEFVYNVKIKDETFINAES